MKYIKEQYDDFRSNTPTYVQWLLLGVAFLIVIILLTLLLSGKSKKEDEIQPVNQHIEFNVSSKILDVCGYRRDLFLYIKVI